MPFKFGDLLTITSHDSKGKGLTYPNMTVIVYDEGCSGGWDVYDGKTTEGEEVSFYGFSVSHKEEGPQTS